MSRGSSSNSVIFTCGRCGEYFDEYENIGQLKCEQSYHIRNKVWYVAADHKASSKGHQVSQSDMRSQWAEWLWTTDRVNDFAVLSEKQLEEYPEPDPRAVVEDYKHPKKSGSAKRQIDTARYFSVREAHELHKRDVLSNLNGPIELSDLYYKQTGINLDEEESNSSSDSDFSDFSDDDDDNDMLIGASTIKKYETEQNEKYRKYGNDLCKAGLKVHTIFRCDWRQHLNVINNEMQKYIDEYTEKEYMTSTIKKIGSIYELPDFEGNYYKYMSMDFRRHDDDSHWRRILDAHLPDQIQRKELWLKNKAEKEKRDWFKKK